MMMTTVELAEMLTTAADRIRDLAAGTSAAPWAEPYYDDHPAEQGWWVLNGREGMRQHAVCSTFALNKQDEADARWIAALSPAVAPMIEAWLREAAEMCGEWEDQMTESAIALAKVLLTR